jgi:hypothetical protein
VITRSVTAGPPDQSPATAGRPRRAQVVVAGADVDPFGWLFEARRDKIPQNCHEVLAIGGLKTGSSPSPSLQAVPVTEAEGRRGADPFGQHGLIVAGGDDGTTRVWDDNGRLLYELPGHDGHIGGLAKAPNGCLVTVGYDGKITRWPAPLPLLDLITAARRLTLPPLTPEPWHRWMLPVTSPTP